jgi:beta-N-acetylhexosaminidase
VSAARRRRGRWPALLTLLLLAVAVALGVAVARVVDDRSSRPASGPAGEAGAPAKVTRPSASPTIAPASGQAAAVALRLKKMTLAEKVGQLVMTYAYGASASDADPAMVAANRRLAGVSTAAELVAREHLGGIILINLVAPGQTAGGTHNMEDPVQIARLCNGLQKAAIARLDKVPLLIGTDQEQGLVTRIGPPATQFPGNMALGADGSAPDAFMAAQITGQELRAMGINVDFAPVADVNVNPLNPVIGVRSFGGDPARVARLTAAAVRGYQAAGIAATAKHFPGHGATSVDSHYALPVVHQSRRQIERVDLPPFESAIGQGVAVVMVGHLDVPALDRSGTPASLSSAITTGWLRRKLGFKGVIITDSLQMGGVRVGGSAAQVPVRAIQAGADIVLMPPNAALACRSLARAVRSGAISEKRLDQSVTRVLELKTRLGLFEHPLVSVKNVPRVVGTRAHRAIARAITQRTITAVEVEPAVLPLRAGEPVFVAGVDQRVTTTLVSALRARGLQASGRAMGAEPSDSSISAVVGLSAAARVTVVTTLDAVDHSGQQALVERLLAAGRRVVVVAVGGPYDIASLPGVKTYLATYCEGRGSLTALGAALAGDEPVGGTLPVEIRRPGSLGTMYPLGHGVRLARRL